MSPADQIFLFSGIAVALTIYGVYKLFKLRNGMREDRQVQPKMRPKGRTPEALIRAKSEDISTPPSLSVAAPVLQDAEADQQSTYRVEDRGYSKMAAGTSSAMPNTLASWTPEPEQKRAHDAFDPIEEEYPYFDQSDYLFGGITPTLAAMMPTSDENRVTMTRALRNAGYYSPHAWHNMNAVRYLCLMVPMLFFGAMLVIVPPVLETTMIIMLVVTTAFGWALPALYIRSKASDRLRQIGNGMPDMLDLLNMCVSQGMTVTSALGRVGRDIQPVYPALAKEMKIVTEQAHIGNLSQSLSNLSQRVNLPEIHSFSSLLIQTEQMGTSVSEALSEYSDNMRESLRQRADEKANSATFKLLFPTVLCLMPAVYLFLLGPAVVELNRFFEQGGTQALDSEIPNRFVEQ